MKDKKQLTIAIVAVFVIIGIVSGGTYAFWTWVTSSDQKTNVSFQLANNTTSLGLTSSLEGNGTTTATNLKPIACSSSSYTSYGIKKEVTITSQNLTNAAAKVTAVLSLTNFQLAQNYNATTFNPTTGLASLKWAITSAGTNCATNVIKQGTFANLYATSATYLSNGSTVALTFTNALASNLPKVLTALEFTVPASTNSQEDTFYLWIWLDSGYTHENSGSVNDDPMQGFNITTQWSGTIANT